MAVELDRNPLVSSSGGYSALSVLAPPNDSLKFVLFKIKGEGSLRSWGDDMLVLGAEDIHLPCQSTLNLVVTDGSLSIDGKTFELSGRTNNVELNGFPLLKRRWHTVLPWVPAAVAAWALWQLGTELSRRIRRRFGSSPPGS